MQDAAKVLLGSSLSSAKEISKFDSDPATYKAGLAVHLANTGALSLLKSAGQMIGVSMGKSLSDTKKTAVLRAGQSVPVKLQLKRARGIIEITDYASLLTGTDDEIEVGGVSFTAQSGSQVSGTATFQAATSNAQTATNLAAQINAHATTAAIVKAVAVGAIVTVYALVGGSAGNAITISYVDNNPTSEGATVSGATLEDGSNLIADVDYVTIGAKAYCNDFSGLFDDGAEINSTITDAVYVSGVLTGIDEDGNEVPAALVDMPGGL